MKKDLNKLTVAELETELEALAKKKEQVTTKTVDVWQLGKNYLIRTVTMIELGRLVDVTDKELVLESASWIADTGRFSAFLNGEQSSSLEVEPFPEGRVIVGRGAVIDAVVWKHDLLRKVK